MSGLGVAPSYARRRPDETVLYTVARERLVTFLARARERDRPVPRFVEQELVRNSVWYSRRSLSWST